MLLLYLVIFVYRLVTVVKINGLDLATITVFFAFIQTLIQNSEPIKKLLLFMHFWFTNIQFSWNYTADFMVPSASLTIIDEQFLRNLVGKAISQNKNLKINTQDIQYFSRKKNMESIITFDNLGVNLVFTKSQGDSIEDLENNDITHFTVNGKTLVRYRKTKEVLDEFISSVFAGLEESLTNIQQRKFSLEIKSGEQDHDYFKKLFIRGIESQEVDQFNLQKRPGRCNLHASEKRIYVFSPNRQDLVISVKNLLFKLSI
ncbi:hypothetical protein SAMN02746098_01582 [Desulfosporosinus lacus DSM 15449]|uniref:Uncharacterized protein n=1 Tax=Desulfosporosinus lacus DSM 15449 TaxID=1121420 RepID=A0A1M5WF82_9FIRM|nr:hypothetical protein SAMN02746098_01582 [Desulfosporosinus lacus DSM 15449]